MLLKLPAAQRAWVKALPPAALAMVDDLLQAKGVDYFVARFDSLKAQMEYCLGFLD